MTLLRNQHQMRVNLANLMSIRRASRRRDSLSENRIMLSLMHRQRSIELSLSIGVRRLSQPSDHCGTPYHQHGPDNSLKVVYFDQTSVLPLDMMAPSEEAG